MPVPVPSLLTVSVRWMICGCSVTVMVVEQVAVVKPVTVAV